MKFLIALLVTGFTFQAMASSPHDRICVGEIAGEGSRLTTAFVLQWRIERTYEQGNPNLDNRMVTVKVRSCVSSYEDTCTNYEAKRILKPTDSFIIPLPLREGKTTPFFSGEFDLNKEEMAGNFQGEVDAVLKLNCVTQPMM